MTTYEIVSGDRFLLLLLLLLLVLLLFFERIRNGDLDNTSGLDLASRSCDPCFHLAIKWLGSRSIDSFQMPCPTA